MAVLGRGARISRIAWLRFVVVGILVVAAALPVGAGVAAAAAPPDGPTEYEVKAAFLYNFARFVEWPARAFPDAAAPVVIGIVGDDPFGDALDKAVSGRTVHNRPIVVKRLSESDDLKGCHVLFVAASDERRRLAVLSRVEAASVLTVGEVGGFSRAGGIIGFYLDQQKVRFEINVRAAERAGLSISSLLLSLARIVG